jgi:FkbM family methyltransferase
MENNSFLKNLSGGIGKRFKFLLGNPYKTVNLNCFNIKYYKHLPPGKIRSHRLFNKQLYFYNPSELVYGLKEIFIEKIYKQEITPAPYIIDCGANIGLSVIYMKQKYPEAEIVAFEPDDINFNLIKKNIDSFGYKNIELRKQAVWNSDTVIHFAGKGSTDSKISEGGAENTVEVQAFRLKNMLNRRVDFLKIDIEGAEYTVLKDIIDELDVVQNLFLEYHGLFNQNAELSEMLAMLTKKGFSYYIKEAHSIYDTPFQRMKNPVIFYDVQLNIFCFRTG